jgi:hypothetical protein
MAGIVAWLLACAQDRLVVAELDPDGCADFDPERPAAPVFRAFWQDADVAVVARAPVVRNGTSLDFAPGIAIADDAVEVREAWNGDGDGVGTCYAPRVVIRGASEGDQVRWYARPDAAAPLVTVVLPAP